MTDTIVRHQVIIVTSSLILSKEELNLLRDNIDQQIKKGLVILGPEFKVITCDRDTILKDCMDPLDI